MRFSQDFIEKVQEANNLLDIISQYTQLKSSGNGYMGRCPFPDHQEKTPSFSLSEMKQVYHCFGCHKKGNIFTFLRDYSGMNFPEAIEYLANRAGMALPEPPAQFKNQTQNYDKAQERKKQLLKLNQLAVQYFTETYKKLPQDHPVKKYTQSRELDPEMFEIFKIGYATDDWEGLVQFLIGKGIDLKLAEEVGLVRERTQGKNGHYDLFRDRLMFSIFSMMGEPIGFGGRVISSDQQPKYLNSPDSQVFHKGKILYGLDQTARYIRTQDQAIIVEGYMDLVGLFQAGIQNVGATLGTALTADHGKLLKRMTKNVIVLFDGDQAGQMAAERSLPILLQAGLFPRGLVLPDELDPDEFVKERGTDTLKKLLNEADELFFVVLKNWLKNFKGSNPEKIKISDQLKAVFAHIEDPRLFELYIKEAAKLIQVDVPWLKSAVKLNNTSGSNYNSRPQTLLHPQQMGDLNRSNSSMGMGREINQSPLNLGPNNIKTANDDFENNKQNQQDVDAKNLNQTFEEQMISLKGLHQAESILISLALKKQDYLLKIQSSGVLERILHRGVMQIFQRIQEVTRHDSNKFDKLTGLLSTFVDDPTALIASMNESHEVDAEERLLDDCIKKLNERFLKMQAAQVTQEMKSNQLTPEKLEILMKIQRDRLGINKSKNGSKNENEPK